MAPPPDPTTLTLTALAVGSTLWVASSMSSATFIFIPSLLRPLTPKPFSPSASRDAVIATPAPSRPASSLQVPTLGTVSSNTDGRLTPQPTEGPNPFISARPSPSSPSSIVAPEHPGRLHAYQTAARQFTALNALFRTHAVPLELVAIAGYGALAWRGKGKARALWAASAGLVAAVFPFTGALMTPLVHKLMRLGGEEEPVEPYEDAPPDREAERGNAVSFLQSWGAYNAVRLVSMLVAVGLGVGGGVVG